MELISTFASVVALITASGVVLNTINIVVNELGEVNIHLEELEAENANLRQTVQNLTQAVSGLRWELANLTVNVTAQLEPTWHLLHAESSVGGTTEKFLIPPEASKIRVVWGDEAYGIAGPAYLCWAPGRNATVCYTNISFPIDWVTEMSTNWLPAEKRFLMLDLGAVNGIAQVRVEGLW